MHINIHLLAIGKSAPEWIEQGFHEYAKRLPRTYHLHLRQIAAKKRHKACDLTRIINDESNDLLAKVPSNSLLIALDEHGQEWNTHELAQQLQKWHDSEQDITLLIGGPDGFNAELLRKAHSIWSLSKLTLPHLLVRVLVAEQLYRAYSILQKHPYHRI